MAVQIIERAAFRIIGLRVETLLRETQEQMTIPKLQSSFNQRLAEVVGAIGLPTTYGLFIDPPNFQPERDPFTWIAGVEVSNDAITPTGMIAYAVPEATYAVLSYQGELTKAGTAYDQLYRWIKDSAYEPAGSFGFELYSSAQSPMETGRADFELHFPVRRK